MLHVDGSAARSWRYARSDALLEPPLVGKINFKYLINKYLWGYLQKCLRQLIEISENT